MTTYRTNGPWGAGKGSKLTPGEVDQNFYDLVTRMLALEGVTIPNPIVNITTDGGQMDIEVYGGEHFLVDLPVAMLTPRGDWVHPEHYVPFDVVSVPGQGGYMVTVEHDTETPFDPNRILGGQKVYQLLFDAGAVGADGPPGPPGPAGEDGADGEPFNIDVSGAFSLRPSVDDQPEGFTYLSTDGEDGLGGPAVIYIKNSNTSGDWSAAYPWEGPAGTNGAAGATGPAGPAGPPGANYDVDATGVFAQRATHDAAPQGFSFLSTNGDGTGIPPGSDASIYVKNSNTSGDWSARIPFQGPRGEKGLTGDQGVPGPAGPAGPAGTNADPDAVGVFSQRSLYNAQPQGFIFLSTNGDGATNTDASLYIKNSNTNGDWSARIPFQGPKGATGPAGPAGSPGPAGPQGAAGTAGVGVPTGGTTGQVLTKTSNANFATGWSNPGGAVYPIETFIFALSDETTNITVGVKKLTVHMPYKGQIVGLPRASLSTAASSGTVTVDVQKNSVSVLSTLVTVDATEKTSATAATPAVVSTPAFNNVDEFTFDVTVAGSGAKGLKMMLRLQQVD